MRKIIFYSTLVLFSIPLLFDLNQKDEMTQIQRQIMNQMYYKSAIKVDSELSKLGEGEATLKDLLEIENQIKLGDLETLIVKLNKSVNEQYKSILNFVESGTLNGYRLSLIVNANVKPREFSFLNSIDLSDNETETIVNSGQESKKYSVSTIKSYCGDYPLWHLKTQTLCYITTKEAIKRYD